MAARSRHGTAAFAGRSGGIFVASWLWALCQILNPSAGGAEEGSAWFREVSSDWGVEFRHHHGGTGDLYMIETMGSGALVFDSDGDGDRDLLLIDSGPLPLDPSEEPRGALFRNVSKPGATRFVRDEASGFGATCYGMGGTVGDVNGDGWLDIYLTCFGANQLFLGHADGSFARQKDSGAEDLLWSTSAAFADGDGDGDLDLYVVNYVDFSFDDNPPCGDRERGLRSYCHPDVYSALPDRWYRNRGDGSFEEASVESGLAPEAAGSGLGVTWGDLDLDGDPDLYVANDMNANFLFRNRGDGTFEEVALLAGAALSDLGRPEAGMGIAVGDMDGDGREDLYITHLDLQTNALYRNAGDALFLDQRFVSRLGEPSMYKVGFGTAFVDLDHDGDLDLAVANGHIIHNIEAFGTGSTFRQENQVFENLGKGRFREVPDSGLTVVESSRGLAAGDLDGDGDFDLVINNSDARAEVYENRVASGRWLQVDLGPRGLGARVEVVTGGRRSVREARAGSSYLSQNDGVLGFGLGASDRAEAVEIRWPGGKRLRLRNMPADHRLVIHQDWRR